MLCPQCNQPLHPTSVNTIDKQQTTIKECFNCGGHFLDSNSVNLISARTAKNIDSIIPKNKITHYNPLACPICKQTLVGIKDQAVPLNVTVYACPEGHGNYFPRLQLAAFKKAQSAKLNYLQIWGVPLKSAFAVLLPVIALFSAVSIIPLTINQLKQRQEARVSAGAIISTPIITPISSTQVLLSFTTKVPSQSKITLHGPDKTQNLNISSKPKNTHIITLSALQPNSYYTYTLTIKPQSQKQEIEVSQYSFTTPAQ